MCNRFSSESWTTLLVSLPPWRALMKTTNSKILQNPPQSLPDICSISVFVSASLTVIRQLSSNQLHYQISYRTKTENTMFCVLESGQPASCFMLAAPRFKLPYQTSFVPKLKTLCFVFWSRVSRQAACSAPFQITLSDLISYFVKRKERSCSLL